MHLFVLNHAIILQGECQKKKICLWYILFSSNSISGFKLNIPVSLNPFLVNDLGSGHIKFFSCFLPYHPVFQCIPFRKIRKLPRNSLRLVSQKEYIGRHVYWGKRKGFKWCQALRDLHRITFRWVVKWHYYYSEHDKEELFRKYHLHLKNIWVYPSPFLPINCRYWRMLPSHEKGVEISNIRITNNNKIVVFVHIVLPASWDDSALLASLEQKRHTICEN